MQQDIISNPKRRYLSLLSIIAINLMPLMGVLFWGWELFPILFYYWLENWVIGGFNVVKMKKANATARDIFFFVVHFGMFTVMHGVFVFAMFGPVTTITTWVVGVAIMGFFVSHWISYYQNFIGKYEYIKVTPSQQMFKPYGRIVIMHIVILFGGFWLQDYGTPLYGVILLIALKTLADLGSHLLEHLSSYRNVSINSA